MIAATPTPAFTSPVAPRYAPRLAELLTLDQAAAYLGLHANTVRRYIREGKLAAFAVGNRYTISTEELARFVEKRAAEEHGLKV
jgi:excisionase family DNA binding protein